MGLASIESNAPQRAPSLSIPGQVFLLPTSYILSYFCVLTINRILIFFIHYRCNRSPEYPSFFGLTHDNMVHVSDMRVLLTPDSNHTNFQTIGFYSPVSPEPFYAGLGLFQLALDEWLPCFKSQER